MQLKDDPLQYNTEKCFLFHGIVLSGYYRKFCLLLISKTKLAFLCIAPPPQSPDGVGFLCPPRSRHVNTHLHLHRKFYTPFQIILKVVFREEKDRRESEVNKNFINPKKYEKVLFFFLDYTVSIFQLIFIKNLHSQRMRPLRGRGFSLKIK